MKAAHGREVVGEGVGVSRFQLLDEELDIGGDEFPWGLGSKSDYGGANVQ